MSENTITIALIGNPNSGKTTLFNKLTGSAAHVGNFPGVTVEKKVGHLLVHPVADIVDLPGIYSLSPYSSEEIVTRDFLLREPPTAIINIIDATNLERNLYLTTQLMELGIPMIMALNMYDEVEKSGNSISASAISDILGIPIVKISAAKGMGLDKFNRRLVKLLDNPEPPKKIDFCSGDVHKAIHATLHIIEASSKEHRIPLRFAATKLCDGDPLIAEMLRLTVEDQDIVEHIVVQMESALGSDREAIIANMRYDFITSLVKDFTVKVGETKEQQFSEKVDKILTHRIFAIPIFASVMLFIFWLTFGFLGATLSSILEVVVGYCTLFVSNFLISIGVSPVLHSLIIEGAFAGVGSVLSFLPTILVLFLMLSLLEDSGYMARIAFVLDRPMRMLGLSGRSVVPLLIGFGCTVPAVMACRSLSTERERKMTMMLTPFMSCSAKLPIYAIFTMALFPKYQALVMMFLYLFGIFVGILSALLMKKNILFRGNAPYVLELPAYRIPTAKNVYLNVRERAKDFLVKAFTVIFLASIIIWVLKHIDFSFAYTTVSSTSILAGIGKFIAPLFAPLGFGDWRIATALISGLSAKEAVISTLAVLVETGSRSLAEILPELFSFASGISFLVFTLLYMPCVAAFAAFKRELGSFFGAVVLMTYQTGMAWLMSFLVYSLLNLIL